MPFKFTGNTPMEYVPFDFEGYIDDSCKELFGHYSFYEKWRQYWIGIFHEHDESVKAYIKKFPNSNPIMERIKHYPSLQSNRYEMYQAEHITDFGIFTFHFDVEAMHALKGRLGVPIETINREDLYMDPDTPFYKRKIEDKRLPYFVRIYGVEDPFVCADGNKRMKARIENGNRRFQGYVFYPEHVERIFFSRLDFYFYIFLREVDFMYGSMEEDSREENVLSVTQVFLQANAGK